MQGIALAFVCIFVLQTSGFAQAPFKQLENLTYVPGSTNQMHLLDLYIPQDKPGPFPIVVWIHGGGWRLGTKKLKQAPHALLDAGIAVASINHRYPDDAVFPAQIHDIKAAVRWIRAHAKEYNLDPNKIGTWGFSSGAHLSALMGTTCGVKEFEGEEGNLEFSSCVQAACDVSGPTDFLKIVEQSGPDSLRKHGRSDSAISELLGGKLEKKKDLAWKASPLKYVTKDDCPILIIHGNKDRVVPLAQSEEFYKALKNKHVNAEFLVIKDGGHRIDNEDTAKKAADFFSREFELSH